MKVLITGAFGFLGGRLARSLRERGHEPILSARTVPDWAAAFARDYEVRLGDVLDPDAPAALVRGVDAVVNLAALDENEAVRDPRRAVDVSGEGTRRLELAAREAGAARFVFFSTFHVYGPDAPERITEETATRAAHPYAIAHLVGEGFCRAANRAAGSTGAIVLRLSNGYGCPIAPEVDRWTLAHNDFCRMAMRDGAIVLRSSGLQRRDFVALEDIAGATHLVLTAEVGALGEGVFNVGGGESLTIYAVAERVAAQAAARRGSPVPIRRPEPAPDAPLPPPLHFAIDRLAALGYQPEDRLDEETALLLEVAARA